MIQVMIVEDECAEAEKLASFLRKFEKENAVRFEIRAFTSALTFLAEYKTAADIVFMDIELPDIDGMEVCRRLRKLDSEVTIIFVTNMAQFAVKGYEVNALEFIVKPLQYYEFSVKLKKALNFLQREKNQFVMIPYNGGMTRLEINEIYYVEIIAHLLIYHTEHGELEMTGSLKAAETLLDKFGFFRCNNCYLVNLRQVREIRDSLAILSCGENLQISRNKRKAFLKSLADFYGGGSDFQ